MATTLADPSTAKKRFIASLSSHKKYLSNETTKHPKPSRHKKGRKKPKLNVKQPTVRGKKIAPALQVKKRERTKLKPKVRVKKPIINIKTSVTVNVPLKPQIHQQKDVLLDEQIMIDANKLTENDFVRILNLLKTRS